MRVQNSRPKVHTGTLTKRRIVSSASTSTNGNTTRSRNSHRRPESREQGARVLWILMIIGGLIGSGFVMAQHSQINVHQFKQAEEKVKTQLDEMTNQQRYLALEKERAINTRESERIAKQSGLLQPKLDSAVAPKPTAEPVAKPNPAAKATPSLGVKTLAKPENKSNGRSAAKLAASPAVKPSTKLTTLTKPAAKQTPTKPVSQVASASKAIKNAKNQQLAQKQETKKDKRH
jgi:hypothetical protein